MNQEPRSFNQQDTSSPWDSLTNINKEATDKWLKDELMNIDDMLEHHRINEEQAEAFRQEVMDRSDKARSPEQNLNEEQQAKLNEDLKYIDQREQNNRQNAWRKDADIKDDDYYDKLREEVTINAIREAANYKAQQPQSDPDPNMGQAPDPNKDPNGGQPDPNGGSKAPESLTEEEKKKRIEELLKRNAELKAILSPDSQKPLIAVNADFTDSRKNLAHDLAKSSLESELSAKKGLSKVFGRIWKGTFFKKHYEDKYASEFEKGERKDAEGKTIDEIIDLHKEDAIKNFIEKTTFDLNNQTSGNLEKDTETTDKIKPIIMNFAEKIQESSQKNNNNLADLKHEFSEEINRALPQGDPANKNLANNYFEVAVQAAERITHELGVEYIMRGFAVYNAKILDGFTDIHRNNVNRIITSIDLSSAA